MVAKGTTLTPEQREARKPKPSYTREQRIERARKGGQAAQQPETYAQKLVRDWPELTAAQKHTVRVLLRPIVRNTP
jgi:hypothetical protein